MKSPAVNCDPWSVLKMVGRPQCARASRSASMQKPRVQRIGQPPRQDPAGVPVDDRHQVGEAARHRDVGDIRGPHLVRPRDREPAKQIGVDRMVRRRRARLGLRRRALQVHPAHQSLDTLPVDHAALGWVLKTRASSMMASSLSTTGAMFTFLALVTGALWGQPTWGTWWVWDARTTSTLILLFLYVGFISLQSALDEETRADHAGAVLALVGVVNVPIIYFSVQWWSTLHQGATIRIAGDTTMAGSMLAPLLIMIAACWLYSVAVVLVRVRYLIREREPLGATTSTVTQ